MDCPCESAEVCLPASSPCLSSVVSSTCCLFKRHRRRSGRTQCGPFTAAGCARIRIDCCVFSPRCQRRASRSLGVVVVHVSRTLGSEASDKVRRARGTRRKPLCRTPLRDLFVRLFASLALVLRPCWCFTSSSRFYSRMFILIAGFGALLASAFTNTRTLT